MTKTSRSWQVVSSEVTIPKKQESLPIHFRHNALRTTLLQNSNTIAITCLPKSDFLMPQIQNSFHHARRADFCHQFAQKHEKPRCDNIDNEKLNLLPLQEHQNRNETAIYISRKLDNPRALLPNFQHGFWRRHDRNKQWRRVVGNITET